MKRIVLFSFLLSFQLIHAQEHYAWIRFFDNSVLVNVLIVASHDVRLEEFADVVVRLSDGQIVGNPA